MPNKIDAKYVKEVEELFGALIARVEGTMLVSDSGQILLRSMQRNVAANFYKKEKQS
ncbi:MAG: hypothetical protein ACLQO1_02610 [Steroidobacteraceae bacterium]